MNVYKGIIRLILLLSLLFHGISVAASDKTGTTGAQFLKLGIGARAVAMGEAFGAVADDINAVYWNPAGLAMIYNSEASFMHTEWFQGVKYQFLGYATRIRKLGVIGVSGNYLTYGNITRTIEDMETGTYIGEDGSFTASDLAIGVSYARNFSRLSLGINAKFIHQQNEDEKATGYAADIGMQYTMQEDGFVLFPDKISLSVHNLGTPMKFIDKSDPLPLYLRIGTAYKLFKGYTNIGFDMNIPSDNDINFNVGVECIYGRIKNMEIAVRTGYKTATINDINALSGLSAGLGFKWKNYGVDYAWVPYGDLGQTHRISLGIKF